MGWPTPQDYNESIQDTRHCFSDKELQKGVVGLNTFGIPAPITGSFASVYNVTCGETKYAVRCLLNDIPDQQIRYQRLSEAICSDKLEYTIDFEFQAKGIKVGKKFYPIVKMPWVSGLTLDAFIQNNYQNKTALAELQKNFRHMHSSLLAEGFAHGDLQHGNILIVPEGIRLVDYDGMFVPSLTGLSSNELGHRNYQHPGRSKDNFGPYLDNFSVWVIDTTLTCLIADSTIYANWHKGNEAIIFEKPDFDSPEDSDLFFALEAHDSEIIRRASKTLRTIISCQIHNVPALIDGIPEAKELKKLTKLRETQRKLAEWEAAESITRSEKELQRIELLKAREKELELAKQQLLELANKEHAKPDWMNEFDSATLESKAKNQNNLAKSSNIITPAAAQRTVAAAQYAHAISNPTNLPKIYQDMILETDNGKIKNYGTSHVVFHITLQTQEYAWKLFTHGIDSVASRYEITIDALRELPSNVSKYFSTPLLIKEAICVDGEWLPGLKSDWIAKTQTLDTYLRTNKPDFDYTLLSRFRKMMQAFRASGIAHGSLEPSNILVTPELELQVIDLDNCYLTTNSIQRVEDQVSADYRHPLDSTTNFGANMDNFQAWIIDTILMCWSADRRLWREFVDSNAALFFSHDDFSRVNGSAIFTRLRSHQVFEFAQRANFLLRCLKLPAENVPHLSADGFPPENFG